MCPCQKHAWTGFFQLWVQIKLLRLSQSKAKSKLDFFVIIPSQRKIWNKRIGLVLGLINFSKRTKHVSLKVTKARDVIGPNDLVWSNAPVGLISQTFWVCSGARQRDINFMHLISAYQTAFWFSSTSTPAALFSHCFNVCRKMGEDIVNINLWTLRFGLEINAVAILSR